MELLIPDMFFIYSEYEIAPLKLFATLISIPPETT